MSEVARKLTGHIAGPVNEKIRIRVVGANGVGGAPTEYRVDLLAPNNHQNFCVVNFQEGSPQEVGVNGITNEVLLAILIDRLGGFQNGPFACRANAEALENLCEAQGALHARTLERQAVGIEGTHEKTPS